MPPDAAPELSVRPIRPDDRKRIIDATAYTSDDTYYRRFHTPKQCFTERELTHLTQIDGVDHVALIATEREHPERLVSIARIVRSAEDPAEAELAVTVHDPYQRQGVGAMMLELIADAARERGITRLRALIQSDNYPMIRLFHKVLPTAALYRRDGPSCEYVAELFPRT